MRGALTVSRRVLTAAAVALALTPFAAWDALALALTYETRPLYTVVGDPANHVVTPGGGLDGVGQLVLNTTAGTVGCSGALLSSGRHVLTAAHCLTGDSAVPFTTNSGSVTFNLSGGAATVGISGFNVHPDWDSKNILGGNDLAVLELAAEAPAAADRYDIDRGRGPRANVPKRRNARKGQGTPREVGLIGDKAGFGVSGTGATGADGSVFPFGTMRVGQNEYDAFADLMLQALGFAPGVDFVPGSVFQYDFDDGTPGHDAFGFFLGVDDLGLGLNEVMLAPGDSGSPTFVDGVIAGIASYGLRLAFGDGGTSDVDGLLNASFGEFGGDTRISLYSSFIDGLLGLDAIASSGSIDTSGDIASIGAVQLSASGLPVSIPEPGTLALFGAGLIAIGFLKRRRPDA